MRFFLRFTHYSYVRFAIWFFFSVAALMRAANVDPANSEALALAAPLILQVQVVEGEGLSYAPGARAVKGITIRVTDEVGRPVAGAAVSFRLPDDGPSGVFQNNSKTEIASTSADGRASVWGMRWGKIPGSVTIRITAAKGSTRAGTVATQVVSADAAGPTISSNRNAYKSHAGGGGKKWLWIGLAAAGAAGGGLAAYEMTRNGSSSAAAATAVNTTISAPQVTVGPH